MAKPKIRIHNEHVEAISKKKCPCEEFGKRSKGNQIYWLFEYHNVRRYTVAHFCKECFHSRIIPLLKNHSDGCGCTFEFVWHGFGIKPEWMQF